MILPVQPALWAALTSEKKGGRKGAGGTKKGADGQKTSGFAESLRAFGGFFGLRVRTPPYRRRIKKDTLRLIVEFERRESSGGIDVSPAPIPVHPYRF